MADNIIDYALQQLLNQSVKIETIWENARPTSNFPQQTINLDLSKYDAIDVEVLLSAQNLSYKIFRVRKGTVGWMEFGLSTNISSGSIAQNISRKCHPNASGVLVENCYYSTDSRTARDTAVIPQRIYGVRFSQNGGGKAPN